MDNNYFKAVFRLALFSGMLLLLNYLFYRFTGFGYEQLVYSPVVVYCFFFLLSAGIIAALNFVNTHYKHQLGFSFMALTTVKMVLCYVMVKPVLEKGEAGATEKINFFIVFIIYLIIEAYHTARLLNKKQ